MNSTFSSGGRGKEGDDFAVCSHRSEGKREKGRRGQDESRDLSYHLKRGEKKRRNHQRKSLSHNCRSKKGKRKGVPGNLSLVPRGKRKGKGCRVPG